MRPAPPGGAPGGPAPAKKPEAPPEVRREIQPSPSRLTPVVAPQGPSVDTVRSIFPEYPVRALDGGGVEVVVPRDALASAARTARDHPQLRFDVLHSLTAVDQPDAGRFVVVLHCFNLAGQAALVLKAAVPRDDPRAPSVAGVWPAADWHERECYDLYGVRFDGHPDLRRILLKEDFVGHPLRKDFADRRPPKPRYVRADAARRPEFPRDTEGPVPEEGEGVPDHRGGAGEAQAARSPGPDGEARAHDQAPADGEARADGDIRSGDAARPRPAWFDARPGDPGAGPFESPHPVRRALAEEVEGTREFLVNLGPQHPSTHGVLRIVTRLRGEQIVATDTDIGYLHRCHEKLMEAWTYPQIVTLVDRIDYLAAIADEECFVRAVERLLGVEVPERAEYLRVIAAELQRITSHLLWFGTFALDLGATTAFLYAFRERELCYDVFETICGARLLYHYLRIGGVRTDFPPEAWPRLERLLDTLEARLPEYHDLVTGSPIFQARTRGVGVVGRELALRYAATGPVLRAAGVAHDLRKVAPYGIYPRFAFEVPVGSRGDALDRYLVRMREIAESAKIIRQAMAAVPAGDVRGKVPRFIRPVGEVYSRVEGPRGEMGCYLLADGTERPWKCKWRAPSFAHLQLLNVVPRGGYVADLVALIGSLDPVMDDVDR